MIWGKCRVPNSLAVTDGSWAHISASRPPHSLYVFLIEHGPSLPLAGGTSRRHMAHVHGPDSGRAVRGPVDAVTQVGATPTLQPSLVPEVTVTLRPRSSAGWTDRWVPSGSEQFPSFKEQESIFAVGLKFSSGNEVHVESTHISYLIWYISFSED